MIDYETYAKIKHHAEQDGLSVQQIAKELNLGWHTVARWINKVQFKQRASVPRPSKLDPYKDYIQQLLEKHDYSGCQIMQRLREQGYLGGYTTVKDYVHKVRPARRIAYLTLSFAPGECAQVDWGKFGTVAVGSTRRKLSFFVMVLCHSRMMYLEFTVLETMEHFLTCHQNAFQFFGGLPENIMIDNLKSGVLHHLVGAAPVFNQRYLDFANHYGFTIKPCAPRKGNEKGRVENGVGYVKKNLLAGLDIPSFAAINPLARQWLDNIANVRNHAATKERPVDTFKIDKTALKALPGMSYDVGVITSVRASSQFRVRLDTNRYSVPAEYAGARLTLKTYPDRLCIYAEHNLISTHPRSYDRDLDFEHPDHPKELIEQRRKAKEQHLYTKFLSLSTRADEYYKQLAQRRLNARHHIQKIVALAEIHGKDVVARAMDDSFFFNAFSSEYIANIIESRSRLLPEAQPLLLTRRQDLLELEIAEPDLSIYDQKQGITYDTDSNQNPRK